MEEYLTNGQLEKDYDDILLGLGEHAKDILLVIHLKHRKEFMVELDKVKTQYARARVLEVIEKIKRFTENGRLPNPDKDFTIDLMNGELQLILEYLKELKEVQE